MTKLEICVDTFEGACSAIEGGADRIELCSSLSEGGLTPSVGLMQAAAELSVPVYAMIRPRGGLFHFTDAEVEIMLADVAKIFRLTKGGKLIEGVFEGATINTPSMLAVEDYLHCLDWAISVGGITSLIARADSNAQVLHDFCASRDWIENLAVDPETRSNTSVCLKFTDDRIVDGAVFAKAVAKRLEGQNVAYDIGSYRDAPAGLRIWCDGTVETSDLEALMPWIDWAFQTEIAMLAAA